MNKMGFAYHYIHSCGVVKINVTYPNLKDRYHIDSFSRRDHPKPREDDPMAMRKESISNLHPFLAEVHCRTRNLVFGISPMLCSAREITAEETAICLLLINPGNTEKFNVFRMKDVNSEICCSWIIPAWTGKWTQICVKNYCLMLETASSMAAQYWLIFS